MNRTQPLVLGIESSCDETGVGIVRGTALLTNTVSSSMDEHVRFGGVIPEDRLPGPPRRVRPHPRGGPRRGGRNARGHRRDRRHLRAGPGGGPHGGGMRGQGARRRHRKTPLRHQPPCPATSASATTWSRALQNRCPGATQRVLGLPRQPAWTPENMGALLVSGGHTEILRIRSITADVELLGSTIDDAAGEVYDKVARLLGWATRAVRRSTSSRAPATPRPSGSRAASPSQSTWGPPRRPGRTATTGPSAGSRPPSPAALNSSRPAARMSPRRTSPQPSRKPWWMRSPSKRVGLPRKRDHGGPSRWRPCSHSRLR